MRGSYWAGIVALLLMPNSSLQIAHAQGGHSEIVCWGENENGCSAHEYTYHAPCGFLGYGGANPRAMINYLCGSGPAGVLKGFATSISAPQPGGQCGYAWFRVVCNN